MPYRVEITDGPQAGESYPLDPARGTLIGRSPTNNIYLTDRSISRSHCQIRVDPDSGQCFVVDLGSTNGTFLNDERITEAPLNEGDVVRAGVYKLRIVRFEDNSKDPTLMMQDKTTAIE